MTNQFQFEPSKTAFLREWPGGYRENFSVYQAQCGVGEKEMVDTCLRPWFNLNHSVLEVGCGGMFWVENYLLPNFSEVYATDLLLPTSECVVRNLPNNKFHYLEAGNNDYSLSGIRDNSVDFVWEFGCFCHLPLPAIQTYLHSIFRVLKPGGHASLFFSNDSRWPGHASQIKPGTDPDSYIFWCDNNLPITKAMLREAGFTQMTDLIPGHCNTMAGITKPQ